MDDMTECALEAINSMDPVLAIALILIIWTRILVVTNTRDEGDGETL